VNEHDNDPTDISQVGTKWGIPTPIKLAPELNNMLRPNDYLKGLGITFAERIDNIVGFVFENLVPFEGGPEEVMPDKPMRIPYAIAQGPFIREVPVLIQAKLEKDDKGKSEIMLSLVPEEE
jgi:hypothetical protein